MSKEKTAPSFTQLVDDFPIPSGFSAENFRSAKQYKPLPNDVFIVTYPKCGTTWTQFILLLIFRKGRPLQTPEEMHTFSPFLDNRGSKSAVDMPRPGAIKTHLPFQMVPWSTEAKYIYVARNPKDCCVSYFHHENKIPRSSNCSFDEFFELFLEGEVNFGDYFDHLLGWYSHRNDPNVLFVTYEELQEDIESTILKMASFLDDEQYAAPIRRDPELLERIKQYSNFKYLKEFISKIENDPNNDSKKSDTSGQILSDRPVPDNLTKDHLYQKNHFRRRMHPNHLRKGIVGDWKNYFSEEQSRQLDEKFYLKTKGTDIPNLWKKYM